MDREANRRDFGKAITLAAAAGMMGKKRLKAGSATASGRLAILGGNPVRTQPFPDWPVVRENDETAWREVLASGKWCRLDGDRAATFEGEWARRLGAKHCLATSSGTTALLTALNALGVGPGDEVIVPPYTFAATINVVMLQFALPVFVDSDRATFQIDANKIEKAITSRTRVILPVHIGGSPANMDRILEVAKAHGIPVLEDACQAHLAEWRHRKLGTIGTAGCFSFQASKNLNSGEGGAVVTNDNKLAEVCQSFHNNGRGGGDAAYSYVRTGSNYRMTEFQAALLFSQLARVDAQASIRSRNAEYLTRQLEQVAGIMPAVLSPGCTRSAYHLYMFRYDPQHFQGLPRSRFMQALSAEGIPGLIGL